MTKLIFREPAPGPAPPPYAAQATTPSPPPAPRAVPGGPSSTASGLPSLQPARSNLTLLLEASAAARRALANQVAEAEAALRDAESQLEAARGHHAVGKGRVVEEEARVAAELTRLARATDAVSALSAAASASPTPRQRTPVAYPPAAGRSPAEETRRLRRELKAAEARRDGVAAELTAAQQGLAIARQAVAALDETMADKSSEVDQRRNVVEDLRQKAAAQSSTSWEAAALSAAAGVVEPGAAALAEIPVDYLQLYRRAASTCPGLSWTVLAAIGSLESAHGRSSAPGVRSGANPAGAMGPMQFIAATWATYGTDGGGDGAVDVYDPADAISGAARYLCARGGGRLATLPDAIWAYNQADWYVQQVLALAGTYGPVALGGAAPADVASLVAHPNLTLTPEARADLLGGGTDPRVVAVLASVVRSHRISVSVIRTGHAEFVKGTTRVSNHFHGRGVDIPEVNGAAVSATNDAALALAVELLSIDGLLRPDEVGSPWPQLSRFPGAFSDSDHTAHLHLGWSG